MPNQKLFLVGATGETGQSIVDALLEDNTFEITCFIRQCSSNKPEVRDLSNRGVEVVTGDLSGPLEDTVTLLEGIDIVISAIYVLNIADQKPLIDAAVKARVKRFVPCDFAAPMARGVMQIRDLKEDSHDHLFRLGLNYTIIDVGYWYELSVPRIPSGKFDYALVAPANDVIAGGTAPNMLTAKKDIGRFTVQAIKDKRTLNKRLYACGAILSQNEVIKIVEDISGETLEMTPKTAQEILMTLDAVEKAAAEDPTDMQVANYVMHLQYCKTKYIRVDNTPENAEYLGYLDGRKLYPDFRWTGFEEFVKGIVAGKGRRPYPRIKGQ